MARLLALLAVLASSAYDDLPVPPHAPLLLAPPEAQVLLQRAHPGARLSPDAALALDAGMRATWACVLAGHPDAAAPSTPPRLSAHQLDLWLRTACKNSLIVDAGRAAVGNAWRLLFAPSIFQARFNALHLPVQVNALGAAYAAGVTEHVMQDVLDLAGWVARQGDTRDDDGMITVQTTHVHTAIQHGISRYWTCHWGVPPP